MQEHSGIHCCVVRLTLAPGRLIALQALGLEIGQPLFQHFQFAFQSFTFNLQFRCGLGNAELLGVQLDNLGRVFA